MYMTRKIKHKYFQMASNAFFNVHFTNFLNDETYIALHRSVDAVMTMTAQGIHLGILQLKDQHNWHKTGIEVLQEQQQIEWNENTRLLKNLIERYLTKERALKFVAIRS